MVCVFSRSVICLEQRPEPPESHLAFAPVDYSIAFSALLNPSLGSQRRLDCLGLPINFRRELFEQYLQIGP